MDLESYFYKLKSNSSVWGGFSSFFKPQREQDEISIENLIKDGSFLEDLFSTKPSAVIVEKSWTNVGNLLKNSISDYKKEHVE